jgi:hypothetical protein
LYIWYNDGTSSQWVPTTNQFGGGYLPLSGGTLTGPLILAADATTALGAATAEQVIGDNRLINGDMRIDQRNNGATGTATSVYTVDRWFYGGSQASKVTWGRNTNGPGFMFPYGLSFTSSSAYAALATDTFYFDQHVEADMISDFAWGIGGAQPVTLSFWAYSSLTGTFSGALVNWASTRSYPFTYSIPTANGWTKIAVTIPGDTTGTWVMSGNGGSLYLRFDLGSGANYRFPAGAWVNGNACGATGAVSIVAINGAQLIVTGVKLEIGSVATPFNRQSLAKSMADCQRYYQNITTVTSAFNATSATTFHFTGPSFPVTPRAVPTIAFVNPTYYFAATSIAAYSIGLSGLNVNLTTNAAGLAQCDYSFTVSAEL